jgi:hypothetical protein
VSRWQPKVVVVLRHPLNIVASHVALGWGASGLDSHHRLRKRDGGGVRWAGLRWIPDLEPGATPLQRLAWQIGLFVGALEAAAQRHPDWIVVSHDDLCTDPPAGFKALCAGLGLPWTDEAAAFLAASDRPGRGLEVRRVAAEQPGKWAWHLAPDQVDEALAVLSGFPDQLFGRASVA